MIIINYTDNTKIEQKLVATIGFFDGVHRGHQYLIKQLKEEAQRVNLPSAVITFREHPRRTLHTDFQPALLCGFEEKMKRLELTGVDYCIVLDFTYTISQMSAKVFLQNVLKDKLNVKVLMVGYDHRFGHGREGEFSEYQKYGEELDVEVVQTEEFDPQLHISSSRIRKLLAEGDVSYANSLLGYNYTISGKIVEGFKVGRTIGFPTANMKVWEEFKVVPAFGVYAVYVHVEEAKYSGMLYIGKRPTLQNGENISLEVNIFDFDEDLYGKILIVEFIEFVRPDEKFPNIDVLVEHIRKDKVNVQSILKQVSDN